MSDIFTALSDWFKSDPTAVRKITLLSLLTMFLIATIAVLAALAFGKNPKVFYDFYQMLSATLGGSYAFYNFAPAHLDDAKRI